MQRGVVLQSALQRLGAKELLGILCIQYPDCTARRCQWGHNGGDTAATFVGGTSDGLCTHEMSIPLSQAHLACRTLVEKVLPPLLEMIR